LADVIKNADSLINTFRDISPTMVEQVYRTLVTSFLYNEDTERQDAFDEISGNVKAVLMRRAAAEAALTANVPPAGDTLAGDNAPVPLPEVPAGVGGPSGA
jgi:hypothetical protein